MAPSYSFARLGRRDLELLAGVASQSELERARQDEEALDRLLARPRLFELLFGAEPETALVRASPFLFFSVLLLRLAADMGEARFVSERVGSGQRVPVFDVRGPREFLTHRERRVFLTDLLISYTRVAGGSVWFRTPRGWRRRRYSELDPLRLAELVEVMPEAQHAQVYRRLGDLCLFLAGVFPDHVAAHPVQPRHLARIARVLGGGEAESPGPSELVLAGGSGLWELEWVGRRAYRRAAAGGGPQREQLRDVARRFGQARRVLDLLARRHLYPSRSLWFEQPGADGR